MEGATWHGNLEVGRGLHSIASSALGEGSDGAGRGLNDEGRLDSAGRDQMAWEGDRMMRGGGLNDEGRKAKQHGERARIA